MSFEDKMTNFLSKVFIVLGAVILGLISFVGFHIYDKYKDTYYYLSENQVENFTCKYILEEDTKYFRYRFTDIYGCETSYKTDLGYISIYSYNAGKEVIDEIPNKVQERLRERSNIVVSDERKFSKELANMVINFYEYKENNDDCIEFNFYYENTYYKGCMSDKSSLISFEDMEYEIVMLLESLFA